MAINIKNFLNVKNKLSKMRDFQDLGHIDGISISAITADLYGDGRDDITLFYFSEGAKYASVYTKSKIVSENIKFNLQLKNKLVKALFINTKNANTFTGKQGFESIKELSKYNKYLYLPKIHKHIKNSWFTFPIVVKKNKKFDKSKLTKYLTSYLFSVSFLVAFQ